MLMFLNAVHQWKFEEKKDYKILTGPAFFYVVFT